MGTHVSFIFRGYNPYFQGLKPPFFMVFGVHGMIVLLVLTLLVYKVKAIEISGQDLHSNMRKAFSKCVLWNLYKPSFATGILGG